MQETKAKTNRKKLAYNDRSDNRISNKSIKRPHRKEKSKDHNTKRNDSIFNVVFKPKSLLEICAKGYPHAMFMGEATQIKIIKDIYPIIKDDISIFAGTKLFNEQTPPYEVLQWMIERFSDIVNHNDWEIVNAIDEYVIEIHQPYDDIPEQGHSFQFYTMYNLREQYPHVYEIFFHICSFLKHKIGLETWKDNELEYAIDICEQEVLNQEELMDDIDVDAYKESIKFYQEGPPEIVNNEINDCIVTDIGYLKLLLKQIDNVPDVIITILSQCIDKVEKLIELNKRIDEFIYIPKTEEYNDTNPLTLKTSHSIMWNCDDEDDPIYSNIKFSNQSTWENYGIVGFYYNMILTKERSIADKSDFPYVLNKLMNLLCDLTFEKYKLLI